MTAGVSAYLSFFCTYLGRSLVSDLDEEEGIIVYDLGIYTMLSETVYIDNEDDRR